MSIFYTRSTMVLVLYSIEQETLVGIVLNKSEQMGPGPALMRRKSAFIAEVLSY